MPKRKYTAAEREAQGISSRKKKYTASERESLGKPSKKKKRKIF